MTIQQRYDDVRAVLMEHVSDPVQGSPVAVVCDGCGHTAAAAVLSELLPQITEWRISDVAGGDDFCPACK